MPERRKVKMEELPQGPLDEGCNTTPTFPPGQADSFRLGEPISREEHDFAMGRSPEERMQAMIIKDLKGHPSYTAKVADILEERGWTHHLFARAAKPLHDEGYVVFDEGAGTIKLTGEGIALSDSLPE